MIALPLLLALTLAPAGSAPCAELTPTSTLADQFLCYKEAGRKVMLPGSSFQTGFDGPACIVGVGADRLQIARCSPGTLGREVTMVPFTSIQSIEDDASKPYVVLRMVQVVVRNDCRTVDRAGACVDDRPVSQPPAGRTRQPTAVAMPPRP